MKILVCGGRFYNNRRFVYNFLDSIDDVTEVVTGGAAGADDLAEQWAAYREVATKVYPAQWGDYGKAAGHIRNKQMLDDNPDIELVVAFPGGKGTANMVQLAKKKNITVYEDLE